jgi:two-component system CheB/CheR fusion protein
MDGRPSILLVEDNLGDAVLLREYLAECRFDYELRHCRTLDEALRACDERMADIVLLDLILPDSKGLPTFEAVHRRAPNVPIVILTGFSDEELASQAVKRGAQDYLPKDDINGTQLTRTIRYAIERKRAEQSLHQAKEAAEAANKAKDRFIASLSHELRTPLTPVLALMPQLERDERLPVEAREAMTMMRRNIELEARLIDDLLDITRVASGKLELKPQVVDLHQLIAHSVRICSADADAKGVRLAVDAAATEPLVRADPDRMQQVLWNLISNAVKFSPRGSSVAIATANAQRGRVELTVSDSGIGIDSAVLPRIFEAFEQGGRAVTKRFGGLGLGLAITRSIVALHEGTLTAASDGIGKGARFTVELKTVSGEARASSRRLPPPAPAKRLRILLVEDHDSTAKVLTLLLTTCGHELARARSVEEGVALAASFAPELLISDIGLPDGTGLDLMRRLRERAPGLRGVVISGYGAAEDVAESVRAGFARHLTKPFSERALFDAIERATAGGAAGSAAGAS